MALVDANIDLSNPRHLAAARGLAAAVRDLEKRGVEGAEVRLHVPNTDGSKDVLVVADPRGLARRAEAAFADEIARALNKLAGAEAADEAGISAWRAATRAALSSGAWLVGSVTRPVARMAVALTPEVVKQRGAQAGEAIMSGLHEGERAYVEVVEKSGNHYVYAPWVVDPIATLANESFAFRLNMAASTIGFVPFTAPVIQAMAAGWLYAWGATYGGSPEGEASKNMAIEAAIQTLATAVPGPGWVTLPAALANGSADASEISEGLSRGDPFVTYFWTRTGRL